MCYAWKCWDNYYMNSDNVIVHPFQPSAANRKQDWFGVKVCSFLNSGGLQYRSLTPQHARRERNTECSQTGQWQCLLFSLSRKFKTFEKNEMKLFLQKSNLISLIPSKSGLFCICPLAYRDRYWALPLLPTLWPQHTLNIICSPFETPAQLYQMLSKTSLHPTSGVSSESSVIWAGCLCSILIQHTEAGTQESWLSSSDGHLPAGGCSSKLPFCPHHLPMKPG